MERQKSLRENAQAGDIVYGEVGSNKLPYLFRIGRDTRQYDVFITLDTLIFRDDVAGILEYSAWNICEATTEEILWFRECLKQRKAIARPVKPEVVNNYEIF